MDMPWNFIIPAALILLFQNYIEEPAFLNVKQCLSGFHFLVFLKEAGKSNCTGTGALSRYLKSHPCYIAKKRML